MNIDNKKKHFVNPKNPEINESLKCRSIVVNIHPTLYMCLFWTNRGMLVKKIGIVYS